MHIPQFLVLFWVGISIVFNIALDGEPRSPRDGGIAITKAAMLVIVLWWGGFWAN